MHFVPVELLIQRALVQYNWKHSIGWLAYDLDSETARFDWSDKNCPPPNILALNPDNGHGHLLYGLKAPVHDYAEARDKPRRYLSAIDVALTAELGADPAYTKLLCKNPLNERWDVLFPRALLYDLDELAGWLDLDKYKDRRRRLPDVGYGRNDTLFNSLRRWAYSQRRNQRFLNEEMFRDVILNHGLVINSDFQTPLPHNEVRHTAKSVSRWTWRNLSPAGFIERQKRVSAIAGVKRHKEALELRQLIIEKRNEYPELGFNQQDIAAMCGVHQATVSRHLKEYKRTISEEYNTPISDKETDYAAPISDKGSIPGSSESEKGAYKAPRTKRADKD